jgi:hypothetical protein
VQRVDEPGHGGADPHALGVWIGGGDDHHRGGLVQRGEDHVGKNVRVGGLDLTG